MSMTHGAPMPTSTAASSMSGMGGMGGMRHNGCKISVSLGVWIELMNFSATQQGA